MTYSNLQSCVTDLEKNGHLIRISDPIDARLEAAEIHRRVFQSGGPALLFDNVVGCQFPMVSNLFGTMSRVRFVFRRTLDHVRRLIQMKMEPESLFAAPIKGLSSATRARHMLPKMVRNGPANDHQTRISKLPQLRSWPLDGGGFVTLPIVYSEDVNKPGLRNSNLGMYRIQLTGNEYRPDEQIGLHYQLHRGIGVHHARALQAKKPFRVNVFVGGAPAMSVAAVMPLPEGMSELGFAGALAGSRIPMIRQSDRLPVYAEADFCLSGTVEPDTLLPEGPFGDHLGYYSLQHEFPVMRIDRVTHRSGAIWPFTVVGRPPQEDTMFGELIHELSSSAIPATLPGVRAVHAVDASGVHPLLLAIGSERYVPFHDTTEPQEILTQANAILGNGQLSLAKYLWIVAASPATKLDIHDIPAFFQYVLRRMDPRRDLHFYTSTTIDTLDYSGQGLNKGSKLVVAAAGPSIRELPTEFSFGELPTGISHPRLVMPGILAVEADADVSLPNLCSGISGRHPINDFPLVVIVDDSQFVSESLNNFLWVTFTRSNPAVDIDGVDGFIEDKHWGCRGSLVIDARTKPHHAPQLETDPDTVRRVDAMATRGGPLAEWL